MADPIPKSTVYQASDGTGVDSLEKWFSRELFALFSRERPDHITGKDVGVARNTCDLFGTHLNDVITLIDRVKAEMGP